MDDPIVPSHDLGFPSDGAGSDDLNDLTPIGDSSPTGDLGDLPTSDLSEVPPDLVPPAVVWAADNGGLNGGEIVAFDCPLEFDCFAATRRLVYRSIDRGLTWTPLPTQPANGTREITGFAARNADTLWVAAGQDNYLRSSSTAAFLAQAEPLVPATRAIYVKDRLFAIAGGVWRREALGSWTLLGNGLGGSSLGTLARELGPVDYLWAGGTNGGVYRLDVSGQQWESVYVASGGVAIGSPVGTHRWAAMNSTVLKRSVGATCTIPGDEVLAIGLTGATDVVLRTAQGYSLSTTACGTPTLIDANANSEIEQFVNQPTTGTLFGYGKRGLFKVDLVENEVVAASHGIAAVHVTGIAAPSGDAAALWVASLGGLFYRSTLGGGFAEVATTRGRFVEVLGVSVSPVSALAIVAVTAKGITYSIDGGASWTSTLGSSMGNGQVTHSASAANVAIACVDGALSRTSDSGDSWSALSSPSAVAMTGCQAVGRHPTTATLYAAALSRVWRSDDDGQTWVALLNSDTTHVITSIIGDPADQGAALYTVPTSGLFRAAGATPEAVTIPATKPRQIVAPPDGSTTLYVVDDLGVLYRPTGQTTWGRLADGVPAVASAQRVFAHPAAPTKLYVGYNHAGLYSGTLQAN